MTKSSLIRYRKPAILAELPLNQHAMIEASAGTGKTYTLEHLYIELLLRGATVDQILVVTFTEKATAELRHRIRNKLEQLVNAGPELDAGDLPSEQLWVLDSVAQGRLLQALQTFDSSVISTIHSFCQRILTEHAFANRQLFTLEPIDSQYAFSLAFKEVLRSKFAREEEYRPFLRAALVAGTDVEQLEKLLYSCSNIQGKLEPVYNERSLKDALDTSLVFFEGTEELRQSLKKFGIKGAILTAIFHRLKDLSRLLTRWIDHRNLARFLQEFEELDSSETYRKTATSGVLNYILHNLQGHELEGEAAHTFRAVQKLAQAIVPLDAALVCKFLEPVRERLRQRKRERGNYEFQDMLTLVRDSLTDEKTGPQLTAALRRRYRFALIDEFQDTDEVQWSIFRRIFFESNRENLLFLIGDPKQAIYSFRGADIHTYNRACEELKNAGSALLVLKENYRSTPELINAYNRIFDQSAPFFTSSTIRYNHPVRCGDLSQRALDPENKPLAPIHILTGGGPINRQEYLRRLGQQIAREIHKIGDPGAADIFWYRDGKLRRILLQDIFILTRSNFEGNTIGDCLRSAGIPYSFYKQDGLFSTQEASDILNVLSAIDALYDPQKRLRAWLSPFFGIPFEEIHRCRDLPSEHPLMALLSDLHELANRGHYERLFTALLAETGLLRRTLLFQGDRQVTNYLHIFDLLLEELGHTRYTLKELLRLLRDWIQGSRQPPGEDSDAQRMESDQSAVQIMTMHKAKGLEAAVVFIAGGFSSPQKNSGIKSYYKDGQRRIFLGRHLPPEIQESIAKEEQQENERLLYVALTRARVRLYLPYIPKKEQRGMFQVDGAYECVNQRLEGLLQLKENQGTMFEEIPLEGLGSQVQHGAPPVTPKYEALEDVFAPLDTIVDFSVLKVGRVNRFVTSYTAMQRGQTHEEPSLDTDQGEDDSLEIERGEDDLPGGAAVGIFLHEIIEKLDFTTSQRSPTLEVWRELPEVSKILRETARTHEIEERFLPHAAQMVHNALTTRISLGASGEMDGFAAATRRRCEVEFLFPIPHDSNPLPSDEEGRIHYDEGYVKGFIDLLFEYNGRLFFADWKSDGLRSFSSHFIEQYVHKNYPRQLQLYSLALVRMLGIHDQAAFEEQFGGLLYVFLRATKPNNGTYFWRPSWDDICRWRDDLSHFSRRAS